MGQTPFLRELFLREEAGRMEVASWLRGSFREKDAR
jgi:hypothetical protein